MQEAVWYPEWPEIQTIGDGERHRLTRDYAAVLTLPGRKRLGALTVPTGFEFNMASIPQWLRSWEDPFGFGPGVVLHDWFYHNGGLVGVEVLVPPAPAHWAGVLLEMVQWTRAQADAQFRLHMETSGVNWRKRWLAYSAVRAVGRSHWKDK